ncbi:MAG: response regulator, partial [Phormidesmis sp.]
TQRLSRAIALTMTDMPAPLPTEKGDILIVDDRPENLQLLFDALSRQGYELRRVLSGQQALQVAQFDPPDLILLDIRMPKLDGYEVCRRLKAQPQTQGIPVIFLSALDEPLDKVKAFDVGGADYVTKPFQIAEVLARVKHQIRLQHLLGENARQKQEIEERSQSLEAINDELELFTSSVSHDLRSPLRGLQGLSRALLEDYGPQLDQLGTTYLQRINITAIAMNQLLDDLLAYSRIDRIEFLIKPVSLGTIVNSALKSLTTTIRAKQATVEVQPNLPQVMGYAPVLEQVAKNLLDNALKYVAPGDRPTVKIGALLTEPESTKSTTIQQAQICWFFQDSGIGISAKDQARIFRPFNRLHGVESYPGSGFGLAIVQRGIARLGGTCGVESSIEQGSRFWIKLPANLP